MAKQITSIKRIQVSEQEIKKRNLKEVESAVSDNKEAILKGINLLATINENRTLDFLNALVKKKEVGLENIMQELNKEQYASILENAGDLLFLIGDLDFQRFKEITSRVNVGMEEALATDEDEKISYTKMIKALKEPEINRSIAMLLTFMRGMGKE
ncbi:DUF1641 domain-containing protein [Virgibacillus sp. MSJ-26]|uniref:DUF1641 domain-containing protein n=1 Tax=Virgibacillus sp. MSJ-26 TaxID=2841522 RepID=UPI001C1080B9|nr:DUF1641 domain-containing protein [Virgibacillus sp. MSJ-26]MBU5466701.1 DUF1641 domain-containing protein [Virgibacillus sp. MSJ-26]